MVAIIPPPPKPHGIVKFAASGLFTVPPGVRTVFITGSGGGASGDGGDVNGHKDGGAAASRFKFPVSVTPGEVIAVTVGAGAAAGAAANSPGTAGNATTFGTYLTIPGGAVGGNPARTREYHSDYGLGGTAGTATYVDGWGVTHLGTPGTAGANGILIVEY